MSTVPEFVAFRHNSQTEAFVNTGESLDFKGHAKKTCDFMPQRIVE
jgi:hypothetical protein